LFNTCSMSEFCIRSFKKIEQLPGDPWGTGKYNIAKYHEVLHDLYNRYGPIVRQDLGSNTIVHVFDPDDIKAVYVNEGKIPKIAPLQESALLYRQSRGLSLGLGN
ncbi:hypothetical protein L9F63_020689, partial [Diploptera punctata]